MASAAFERFRFSFFEDAGSARDGLDIEALSALEGEERARAEDMLLQYLPDTRGVIGLGVLRARAAEPALSEVLESEQRAGISGQLIYVATALWQIRPNPRWLGAVAEALTAADDPILRMRAAIALGTFQAPAALGALIQALDDEDSLVRHHAARGLLKLHGLPTPADDCRHMIYRVMSDEPPEREAGKRDILAAIDGRMISG